jgi:hypothetical protein
MCLSRLWLLRRSFWRLYAVCARSWMRRGDLGDRAWRRMKEDGEERMKVENVRESRTTSGWATGR